MSLSEIGAPPIEGSSVPADREAAISYAHRLERRYYQDQDRIFAADRKLAIALDALREALRDHRAKHAMRLVEAIAAIEAARETLI